MTSFSAVAGPTGLVLAIATLLIGWRFDADIKLAYTRIPRDCTLIATRCGPIENQAMPVQL